VVEEVKERRGRVGRRGCSVRVFMVDDMLVSGVVVAGFVFSGYGR
jgi:hypothetical protein